MSRAYLSVRLDLLDAQIVDSERRLVGKVDDLELDLDRGGAPRIAALLTGLEALGERLGGPLGHAAAATASRLRPRDDPDGPTRIDAALVRRIDTFVELRVALADLPHVAALERWLARNLVARIPGAGDARD
jgi:hypothetical protein